MSKPTRTEVSADEVRTLIRPNYESGKLYWCRRPVAMFPSGERACRSWNSRFGDTEAFTARNSHGYLVGTIFGKLYTAHRVMWCLAHGDWPPLQVDHINGDRSDNKITNLRLVTNAENHMNAKLPANNSSGHVGVYLEPRTGAWVAQVYVNRQKVHLGSFRHRSDAVAARKSAERLHGYHSNHGRTNG